MWIRLNGKHLSGVSLLRWSNVYRECLNVDSKLSGLVICLYKELERIYENRKSEKIRSAICTSDITHRFQNRQWRFWNISGRNNQFVKEDSANGGNLNSNPHIIELLMAEIEKVKKSKPTMLDLMLPKKGWPWKFRKWFQKCKLHSWNYSRRVECGDRGNQYTGGRTAIGGFGITQEELDRKIQVVST